MQEKKDSSGVLIRKEIATLLSNGHTSLARTKAQKLLQEDAIGDVLEVLEMHVGLLLERIHEFEQVYVSINLCVASPPQNDCVFRNHGPTAPVLEAASSIIYCAPRIESKGHKPFLK